MDSFACFTFSEGEEAMFDQGTSGASRNVLPALSRAGAAPGGSAVDRAARVDRRKCCLTHYGLELLIEILQRMNDQPPADRQR
jgi:hypothetical protein